MSDWFSSDVLKVTLLVGAFLMIYGLSRWASRLNESSSTYLPPVLGEPTPPERMEPQVQWSKVVTIDRQPQFHSSQNFDEEQLRPVRIVQMYFSQFDYDAGPADPASFADELFVKLYDENSGYDWTQSYFVATPRGMDEMLQREKWDYAYTDRVFFVRRYDAKVIRQAVVEHLMSNQERPSPPKEQDRYV